MSGALTAGSQLFSVATQAYQASGLQIPAFIRHQRSIGTIIPDVTIEEHHQDRLIVTQHPLAKGSPISDHAYRLPATITMRCGWTNSNPIAAAVQGVHGLIAGTGGIGAVFSGFTESRASDVYQTLLNLQSGADRKGPQTTFQLTTGKRSYDTMLITDISVTTDRHSEYALIVEVQMQEVIIAQPQTTNQPAQADQADPSRTAATQDDGPKQPDPQPESWFHKLGIQKLFGGT